MLSYSVATGENLAYAQAVSTLNGSIRKSRSVEAKLGGAVGVRRFHDELHEPDS